MAVVVVVVVVVDFLALQQRLRIPFVVRVDLTSVHSRER